MQTKICRKTECQKEKPIEDFPKHKGYIDGRSSWCRQCHNSYCLEDRHRILNRDRRRELRKDPEYRKKEQAREKLRQAGKVKETLLVHLRSQAKGRGLDFDLTLEDIPDTPLLCPILKEPMIKLTRTAPSVDRIDSTKGYVKGNIQIISRLANTMKLDASIEQLIAFSKYWIKQSKIKK